jgi:hypothetical protein
MRENFKFSFVHFNILKKKAWNFMRTLSSRVEKEMDGVRKRLERCVG